MTPSARALTAPGSVTLKLEPGVLNSRLRIDRAVVAGDQQRPGGYCAPGAGRPQSLTAMGTRRHLPTIGPAEHTAGPGPAGWAP
jgi:hypothetical protein